MSVLLWDEINLDREALCFGELCVLRADAHAFDLCLNWRTRVAVRGGLEATAQGHPAQSISGAQNPGAICTGRSPNTFQEDNCGLSENWVSGDKDCGECNPHARRGHA